MARRVLLTRPIDKLLKSKHLLEQAGHQVVSVPLVNIESNLEPEQIIQTLLQAKPSHVIVTSTYTLLGIEAAQLPAHHQYIAIGGATSSRLEELGVDNIISPKVASSEGVLAMKCFRPGQTIFVLKGVGGRDILEPELNALDCKVTILDCYKRVLVENKDFANVITEQTVDTAVATSVELLEHMFSLCSSKDLLKFKGLQWVAISQRVAQRAKDLGVEHVVLMKEPGQQALVDAVSSVDKANT